LGGKKNDYKSNKSSSEIILIREASHSFKEVFDENGFTLNPVLCAMRLLDQIYFVIEMVEEMIFKHIIRGDCLNFKTDFIF
jgi:hypothetical protein